jgi:hypothetical protein
MTDGFIPILGLAPEKRLHTKVVTTGDGEVHDEVVEIAGGTIDTITSITNDVDVHPADSAGTSLIASTTPAQTDPGMVVRPVPYDFRMSVAKGLVTGHALFDKWGRIDNVDNVGAVTPPVDVWHGATLYTGFPAETETIEVHSTHVDDNGVTPGPGLRSVRLFGLDATGVEKTADVTLDGTTWVTVPGGTWSRMPRMRGLTSGGTPLNSAFNAGAIIARHTTTANIFASMPEGTNRTHIMCTTVPLGKTAFIESIKWHMTRASGAAGSAVVALMQRDNGSVWEQTYTTDISTGGAQPFELQLGTTYAAMTDLCVRVIDVSDNDTAVSAFINGMYVDD